MDIWLILLIGLWAYPILSFILLKWTVDKPNVRKWIFYVAFIMSGFSMLGYLTNISTTLSELDWVFISSNYFSISLVLWWTQFQKNKLLKISGVVIMLFTFGIGYLSGTVGALGVGFVVSDYVPETEKWLGDGLIYKECNIGNATTDYRGKQVEIFKTIQWLPIIEWRTQQREYHNTILLSNELTLNYEAAKGRIILSAKSLSDKNRQPQTWVDTLALEQ